ncbi:MAG: hypothetical protein AAF081_00220 [Actinomycetota bacterium]
MGTRPIVRDALRLFVVWLVVFVVVTAALFLTTDGEPICEGPLIVDVDSSDPPQCNTPVEGFERQLWGLLLGTLIVAAVVRVVIVLVAIARNGGRRERDSVPA